MQWNERGLSSNATSPKQLRCVRIAAKSRNSQMWEQLCLLCRSSSSYPLWIFHKIAPTGALVDPFRVDPFLYGSFGLTDDLSKLGIFWEFVPVRLPGRVPSVPIQERLSLPAAVRTAGRDTHHGARCASERAAGAGGLRGAVAKVTRAPQRRDKRTRLVHTLEVALWLF